MSAHSDDFWTTSSGVPSDMASSDDDDPRDDSETPSTNPSSPIKQPDPVELRALSSLSLQESTSPPASLGPSNLLGPTRTFTKFPLLPPEIRALIWQQFIEGSPRMNFVKLESSNMDRQGVMRLRRSQFSWIKRNPNGPGHADEIAAEVQWEATNEDPMPKLTDVKRLMLMYPDKGSTTESSHHNVQQLLTILASTCRESRAIVNSTVSQPGTLRLGDGSVLSTAGSSDITFLDYYPPELYGSRFGLAIDPNTPELSLVRRLAVRFCYSWHKEMARPVCPYCQRAHGAIPCRFSFPRHLYHLLARFFPSLEEFYLVDYLTVRKPQADPRKAEASGATPQGPTSAPIECGNRTFWEANPDEWLIKPHVLNVKSWLADRFVLYANSSRLSKHQNPDRVRFGILACEFAIAPPKSLASNLGQTTKVKCSSLVQICKLRLKNGMARRKGPQHPQWCTQSHKRRVLEPSPVPPVGVGAESGSFIFGGHGGNSFFDFTFRCPGPAMPITDLTDLSPDH